MKRKGLNNYWLDRIRAKQKDKQFKEIADSITKYLKHRKKSK